MVNRRDVLFQKSFYSVTSSIEYQTMAPLPEGLHMWLIK